MDETLEIRPTDITAPVPAHSNATSHSGSDDTDSDDSDSDQQQNLQLQTLELELSTNPSNYDAHIQYIKLLRRMSLIGKLRSARESMRALFPLSPDMWQEWIMDETTLATGPEDFSWIERLYEKGISDYQSVSLWCDYINFVIERDPSVRANSNSGIVKARDLFERAVSAAGLHVMEGNKIWEAYREYEQAILQTVDNADTEARGKQIQHIRSIFHRQLSVPLADSKSTLLAYKAWGVEQGISIDADSTDLDGISPLVASAYQKALQMYIARAPFEEKISGNNVSDSDRLQSFMNYLKFEQSLGDPVRVQNLYERAVVVFPVASELWLDYTRYLDETVKVAGIIKSVYSRATKSCPWVGQLWVKYLISLERGHASEEEISDVFERSMTCTLSSFHEYLDVFLIRIDGLRRRFLTTLEEDCSQRLALLRETFQRAVEYLSPHLKNTDDLLSLHHYWANLELNIGKDLDAARRVWENLIKTSGSMLAVWKGYIAMEVGQGNIYQARSLYKRCYSRKFGETGSEFERQCGTLQDYDHAVEKVAPRLKELRLFKLQQESKSSVVPMDQTISLSKRKLLEKRKPDSDYTDEQPSAKKKRGADQLMKKGDLNNVSRSKKGVESNRGEGKEVSIAQSSAISGQEVTKHTQPKVKSFEDQCTAFISNLSFKANPEDLKEFFKDVGGVKDIRILKDKFTRVSRGLAYVDFCDDDHLAAAIAKNKQTLLGKRISIARSDPKRGKKVSDGQKSTANTGGEKGDDRHGTRSNGSGDDGMQLKGRNTFAVPRNVRPPGFQMTNKRLVSEEEGGAENPKSNDEFRKMFIK
uniref:RRM domain-containing protein n=1 Tax=Kalanchoe fedtschenkoi TaxID=63787 RepID=A0A7N0TX69_KALFE